MEKQILTQRDKEKEYKAKLGKELVKELPKGLLNWYNFKKNSRILYIGKEDSYVQVLKTHTPEVKYVDCVQLRENQWQEQHKELFDYVVCIELLESDLNPIELIQIIRSTLKREGIFLLGMNNRLGLRYFCGDRDVYTGRSFDGIEGYRRAYVKKEDIFHGRMYAKAEIRRMLLEAGWKQKDIQFFSILTDLQNPSLIYAENYLPNEDLANRVFPTYNYPNSVFLEEEALYQSMIENGMFHQTANAYLIECSMCGIVSDVAHVTVSMERGKEDALLTVIHKSGIVEKKAAYPEGEYRLEQLIENGRDLKAHGLSVVDAELVNGAYCMPFIKAEVGQLYLKRLLQSDKESFFKELDHFRDLILQSSEIVEQDIGDGEGAILRKGYLDLVPLNSFHIGDEFVFYDQEFCVENYPANVLILRMVTTLYAGNMQLHKILPIERLYERYHLMRYREKWQRTEWEFLGKLLKQEELWDYHKKCRRNVEIVNANRQHMNYAEKDYRRLFIDIFHNAGTRKLVLFGAGKFTERFLVLYGKEYSVYAVIDNNKEKWGQKIEGIVIQSPQVLSQLQSGEYKVLICIKNYLSVMKQLDDMGVVEYSVFDPGRDYIRERKTVLQGQQALLDNKNVKEQKKFHTGYIAGVFDLFHVGHLNMFKRAKEQCEYLIVGVVSDEGVRKYKKVEPFVPFEERIEMVRSCRYVDEVVEIPLNCGGTRYAYRLHHFDCLFSGSDYEDNPDWIADKKFLEEHGAEMVFFPYTQTTSSTKLKGLIEKFLL